MKKYLSLFFVLVMTFTINSNVVKAENDSNSSTGWVACTTDVKQCPNGSYVSRTGPNCEFEKCSDFTKTDLKEKREGIRNEIKDKRDEIKTRMEVKREELKEKREAMREEAKQKMEDLKEKIKEEKDGAKAKIKELRIEGREKALERFDKAVERMTNLKDKILRTITTLKLKGVDVTGAEGFMATAETKLNEAKAKIAEINILLSISIKELTPENKTNLRTITKEIQTLVKETHNALKDSTKALKDAVKIKTEAEKNIIKGLKEDNSNRSLD